MKAIQILILFFYSHIVLSQNNKYISKCLILKEAINYDFFNEHFFICKYKENILSIIDTNNNFANCELSNSCPRSVNIITILEHNIDVNKTSFEINKNLIVNTQLRINRKRLFISFWQPYSNATLTLQIRHKKGKILNIDTFSFGVF